MSLTLPSASLRRLVSKVSSRHRPAPSGNNSAHCEERFNIVRLLGRSLSLLLIISLLSTSTFAAAPQSIIAAAGETYQDARFAFLASDVLNSAPRWLGGVFSGVFRAQQNNQIVQIQIYPGSVTIRAGEEADLAAVALNSDGDTLSAVPFAWTSVGEIDNPGEPQLFANGVFRGRIPGDYTVTAAAEGVTAAVTVTVLPDEAFTPSQSRAGLNRVHRVSSRADLTGGDAAGEKEAGADESENPTGSVKGKDGTYAPPPPGRQLLPQEPGDGGWNNGNHTSMSDPGNQTGNPPGGPLDDGALNSNYEMSAPVLALPGRGIDLALNLNYNARLWNRSGTALTYDSRPRLVVRFRKNRLYGLERRVHDG